MNKRIIILLIFLIVNLGFGSDIDKDLFHIDNILFKNKNSEILNKGKLEGIISLDYERRNLDKEDSKVKLILKENGNRKHLDFFSLLDTNNIIDGVNLFLSSKKISVGQTLELRKIIVQDEPNERYEDEDDYELTFSKVNKNNLNYLLLDFNFINSKRKTFPSIQIEEKDVKTLLEGLNKLKDNKYIKESL